jgi:hypothetical protein
MIELQHLEDLFDIEELNINNILGEYNWNEKLYEVKK